MKFTFGKYKNKDVHEIMDLDPNYCLWLYRSDLTKERNRTLFEILENRFKDDGENIEIYHYDKSHN